MSEMNDRWDLSYLYSGFDDENFKNDLASLAGEAEKLTETLRNEDLPAAQLLENAGKAGNMDYIRAHHENFIETYRGFKAQLAEVFEAGLPAAEKEKPEADMELMEAVYEELLAAAEEMDSDRLEEIIAEMDDYRIPETEVELYKKIKQAVEHFEYETILSLLNH